MVELTAAAFDQQIEIATLYKDDKFVGLMKKCRDLLKQVDEAHLALKEREDDLSQREREAKVVLDSQETFNAQHKTRMTALEAAEDSLNGKRDAFKVDKAAQDIRQKAEAERLAEWEADLSQKQNAVDRVLKTEAKKIAALERAKALESQWRSKIADLGLQPV